MAKVYVVQGKYGHGWEDLCEEDNREDAEANKREYDIADRFPHRVVTRTV